MDYEKEDKLWSDFALTGSIESYLKYKEVRDDLSAKTEAGEATDIGTDRH